MFKAEINNIVMEFETSPDVFSPSGVDEGILAMLSLFHPKQKDKVLDLGCGYGVVGIYAAKIIGHDRVVMSDISEEAIGLAKVNAEKNSVPGIRIYKSDGLKDIPDEDFTYILSNPPYHVDFSVPKHFIEDGYKKLAEGGTMLMVTKRKNWYKRKFIAVFGGVKVVELNGYYVFVAVKLGKRNREKPANENRLSKKLQRKYERRYPKTNQAAPDK